jgi:16S rRNA (guanine527-N7)-methyltransferase
MSRDLWNTLAGAAGLSLDPQRAGQFDAFLDLLMAANRRMNLTRITDRGQAEVLHVADSLTLLPHLPPTEHRLVDVGSGGGVPGMVLAIARPDIQVMLVESTRKKADFLLSAAKELKLTNVLVEPKRAEEVARSPRRESFDVAVARAVAVLPVLVEWLLPLVKVGGWALAMKGPKAVEEMKRAQRAIKSLGGGQPAAFPADLPAAAGHLIVKVPKISRTPDRFPRPPSVAKGLPI